MEKPEGQEAVADAVEEHQVTEAIPAEEVLPSLRETDPPASDPDKPAEATAVTKGEVLKMARALNERVTKKLNAVKDKQVIR